MLARSRNGRHNHIYIYIYIYKFGVNLIKVDKPSSLAQCASTKLKDKGIDGK